MIHSLRSKLKQALPQEAEEAQHIQSAVDRTIAHTHDPAQDLASFGIQEDTLPQALKGLADRAQTLFHVPCRFNPNGAMPRIDPDVFDQIYNIAQEAVVDAVKYAEANRVAISFARRNGQLVLAVQNNGHSFPTPLHHSLDLSLKIMNYRAGLIDAMLQIAPADHGGTELTCSLIQERHHEPK